MRSESLNGMPRSEPSAGLYTVYKECREALDLTQAELAQLAKVNVAAISHLETGVPLRVLCAMHAPLAERVAGSCAAGKPDAAALRALARLADAISVDQAHGVAARTLAEAT